MLQITGINASLKITIYTLGGPGGAPPPSGIMERGGGGIFIGELTFLTLNLECPNKINFCFVLF